MPYMCTGFHEMTISDLKADVDAGADIFVLDVRHDSSPRFLFLQIRFVILIIRLLAFFDELFCRWHCCHLLRYHCVLHSNHDSRGLEGCCGLLSLQCHCYDLDRIEHQLYSTICTCTKFEHRQQHRTATTAGWGRTVMAYKLPPTLLQTIY